MRELAFAGLTDDGALLLTAGDGQQYSVDVDDRLVAAVRGDRPRLGQLKIALEGVSPRDIQARVRHGQSPYEVAEQSGIPLERVERFAGPPLAEREHVAGLARDTEVGRTADRLEELVTAALEQAGDDLQWDSWRRDDGQWTVLATWTGGAQPYDVGRATWTFAPAGRTLSADDDTARALQGDPPAGPEPAPLLRVVADDLDVDVESGPAAPWAEGGSADWDDRGGEPGAGLGQLEGRGRLWDEAGEPDGALTAVVDRYSGEVLDLSSGPPSEPGDLTPLDDLLHTMPGLSRTRAKSTRRERRKAKAQAEPAAPEVSPEPAPEPVAAEPRRAARRPNKPRAVVPSWDEILFGSRRPDD